MKQKVRTLGKIHARWKILAIAVLVLGVMIPSALAVDDTWWGSADGDNNKDSRNYVIHPPADDKPTSNQDGTRLQFIIHKFLGGNTQAGASLAYLPHQYLISSTQPKLTFDMRGGYWNKTSCPDDGGTCADTSPRDRYDRKDANPGWVVDFTKSEGFLSPAYYEVYQLWGDVPQAGSNGHFGKLLGVLNPRDSDVFPTTDNNPNSNTDCNYVTANAQGPCWRTFTIDANGGLITVGNTPGALQDSCAKRLTNHNNQCYSGNAISYGNGIPGAHLLAENWDTRTEITATVKSTLALGRQQNPNAPPAQETALAKYGNDVQRLVIGEPVKAAGSTHPVDVHVNPGGKAAGHVDVSVQGTNGGQCTDQNGHFVDKATKPWNGSTVSFACEDNNGKSGNQFVSYNYNVSVSPADFDYNLSDLNQGGCHIGNDANDVNIGGGGGHTFDYACRHRIRVFVNPTNLTGGHVKVRLTGGECSGAGGNENYTEDHPGQSNDGSAFFSGCQDDMNYTAHADTQTFYDSQGDYYCEQGNYSDSQNFGASEFEPQGLKYHCYPATAQDGNKIGSTEVSVNSGRFTGIDQNSRFNSTAQPNLNGNYVFLIKAVSYSDIGSGYVTDYERVLLNDSDVEGRHYKAGCPQPTSGNVVGCPNGLLTEAGNHSNDHLVQDGFFLRTPKTIDGNTNSREYISSAPTKWAFNFNYGPTSPPGGETNDYAGLRFQAGGSPQNCRDLYNLRIPNADWDSTPFAGSAFDHNIQAGIERIGSSDDMGNLNGAGAYGPLTVDAAALSSDWRSSTTNVFKWAMQINDPGYPNADQEYWPSGYPNSYASNPPYFPSAWQDNEAYTGRLHIKNWDDGNNLIVGGQPFTWGFWPTCRTPSVQPQTPKDGYTYDGTNSDNAVNIDGNNATTAPTQPYDYVTGTLNFKFTYNIPETRGQVHYRTELFTDHGATNPNLPLERGGTITKTTGDRVVENVPVGSHDISNAIEVGDLRHDTDYYWRSCITMTNWATQTCSDPWRFRVNQGPAAVGETGNSVVPNTNTDVPVGSGPGAPGVNYKCAQLASRLTDPEADPTQVRPYYTVSWNDGYGTNTVYSHVVTQQTSDSKTWSNWEADKGTDPPDYNYGYKADGSSFTSDEVSPRQWRRGGSLASLTTAEQNMTMTEFLQTKVPDGTDITWTARGEDRYGAADLTDFAPPLPFTLWNKSSPFTVANNAGSALDQQSPLINRRIGLPITTTFHKNSPPNFSTASTKKFQDLTGGTITTVIDGQTIRVETTFVNGGETPSNFYALRDYLGSLRDFERPSDITIRKNDGTTITLSTDEVLKKVIPDTQQIENGSASVNDPRNATHDEVLSGEVDPKSTDYVRGSWRIDLGTNQDGPLADPAIGGPGNVMNPGDSITLKYQVRANRNQQLLLDDQNNDFQHSLSPSDTHGWAYYQENYCDSDDRVGKPIEQLPGTIKAPWLRAHRGSVASNGGIFGYDALNGQSNATFLVQANGILSHFSSGTETLPSYTSRQAICTATSGLSNTGERPGGVDWRRTMITNIGKLLDDSHHGTTETRNTFTSASGEDVTLNPGGGSNVWIAGSPDDPTGLTIDSSKAFKGVGTLVVFGDLNIGSNVSLTYQTDDGSVNSLGVIVVGNLNIDPSVTDIVGNFYVLDSDAALDDDNCPVNIDEGKTSRGRVNTGSSATRLNIKGLIVAGAFDLLRYYVDPNDNTVDPAENIYYDGRVLANTPPGFGTFRNTASWQEIAP